MAWIELHQSIWSHRKTFLLAAALGIDETYAAAHMIRLWTWSLDNANDGDLTGLPSAVIAYGAGWKGDPQLFVESAVKVGFLDRDGDQLFIHDWYEYAGKLLEKREARKKSNREAQARRRQRLREQSGNGNGSNITINPQISQQGVKSDALEHQCTIGAEERTQSALTSVHDQHKVSADVSKCKPSTVPNHTVPNQDDYKIESTYKALGSHLEPENVRSSSSNDKDKNQEIPFSNPGGIEGTELSGDRKENSAGGFQKSEDLELGKLARMYEEEGFGALTETVRETLVQMYDEFGATWVAEAMREAVLQNKRRLKYVVGILENWRREGGMRRSDGSKGAATDAKAPRRSRADPEPVGRYIPDGPPEDPELDEFLRKAGFYDIPGINC